MPETQSISLLYNVLAVPFPGGFFYFFFIIVQRVADVPEYFFHIFDLFPPLAAAVPLLLIRQPVVYPFVAFRRVRVALYALLPVLFAFRDHP